MAQPLVSILVPIYQAESHLPVCLDSICRQSYENLQIILVHDGGTDGSLAICRDYAARDGRIQVIDQPNAGVSAARNRGLEAATGAYLQFVDGDDRLTPDATELLVREGESTGADLVVAHFYRVVEEKLAQRGHIKRRAAMTRTDYAQRMMTAPSNYYYGVLWNKLYRRNLVGRNGLRFDESLHWCEDFLFNLEYLRYCRLVATLPQPVYYYYKREGSLVTTNVGLRKTVEMKKITFAYYKQLYQSLDLYEEQRLMVYRYLISAATDGSATPLPQPLFQFSQPGIDRKIGQKTKKNALLR